MGVVGLGRPISRGTKDPIRSFCLCPCLWGPLEQPLWSRLALWYLRWPSPRLAPEARAFPGMCMQQGLRPAAALHRTLYSTHPRKMRCGPPPRCSARTGKVHNNCYAPSGPTSAVCPCTTPPFRSPCFPGGPLHRPPCLLHPVRVVVPTGPGPTSPPKGSPPSHHVLWAAEKDAAELRDDLHASLKLTILVLVVDPCPGSGILFEVGVLFHGLHDRQRLPQDDELLVVGVVVRGVHRCQNNSQRRLELSLPLGGIRHHLDVLSPHWLVLCKVEGCPRASTILLNKGLPHVPRLEGEHRHCRKEGALWYSCGLCRQYIQILCRGVVVLEKTSHFQKSRHGRDLLQHPPNKVKSLLWTNTCWPSCGDEL